MSLQRNLPGRTEPRQAGGKAPLLRLAGPPTPVDPAMAAFDRLLCDVAEDRANAYDAAHPDAYVQRELLVERLAERNAEAVGAEPSTAEACSTSEETIDAWFLERYFPWKEKQPGKNGSIRQDLSKYRAWISPRVGHLPIAAPRAELAKAFEELRDDLDDAVHAYNEHGKGKHKDMSSTSGRNALGIWRVLVTGMNYAHNAKRRSGLRVRDDNPCDDIRPPDKSPKKYKTVIRPVEWTAVAACEENDRGWRETWAVMLYAGLRPGEGHVLEWSDVDFTTDRIRVSKAWDYGRQVVKPPKTGRPRDVPIEPTLRPLLVAMRARARGALVLPKIRSLADETAISKVFRRHLEAAGVDRDELLPAADPKKRIMQIPARFRALRDWYITWRLWRGDNPIVVMRDAGHEEFSTTQKYLADVEKLSDKCGVPFPALPSGLVGPEGLEEGAPEGAEKTGGCERRELKPTGDGSSASAEAVEPPSRELGSALAFALHEATRASQWSTVAELARAVAAVGRGAR